MSFKDRIVSPDSLVNQQGVKILVYGAAGAGKTTLCGTAPGKKTDDRHGVWFALSKRQPRHRCYSG